MEKQEFIAYAENLITSCRKVIAENPFNIDTARDMCNASNDLYSQMPDGLDDDFQEKLADFKNITCKIYFTVREMFDRFRIF